MNIPNILEIPYEPEIAFSMQEKYASQVQMSPPQNKIKTIAGADVSYVGKTNEAYASVVVIDRETKEIIEEATWSGYTQFPYRSGLLALREAPCLIELFKKLSIEPDLIIVDGHGQIHPRGFGLACHMGLCFERPTIGCAKTFFIGNQGELDEERGAFSNVTDDNGRVMGLALRTQKKAPPVYASVGNLCDLDTAQKIIFELSSRNNRLPLPVFYAHHLCSKLRKKKDN
ncbi:endonuclease V [Candidatus Uabimicrobium sp. HlEnr_7]|uniref:endonuclease V n=1 Tax=Candidatus Uabimicrobium helgolandensis TaxID=3095367 RepID=UPI00355732EF